MQRLLFWTRFVAWLVATAVDQVPVLYVMSFEFWTPGEQPSFVQTLAFRESIVVTHIEAS